MKEQLEATGLVSVNDSFVLPSSHPITKAANSYLSVGADSATFSPPFSSRDLTMQKVDLITASENLNICSLTHGRITHPFILQELWPTCLSTSQFDSLNPQKTPSSIFLKFVFSHFIGLNQLIELAKQQKLHKVSSFLGWNNLQFP